MSLSERSEGTRTPLWAWVGVLMCLVSGAIILFGALTVFHRQEACVQAVKVAHGQSLSTWEAVERCSR